MSDPRAMARRELRLLRRDARQPWRRWPRRLGGAIVAATRAVAEFFRELILEIVGEALFTLLAVGLLAVVGALVSWGWARSPAATIVLLAGIIGFLGYGGYELVASVRRRKGRLAATAAGATGFVVLWASYVATYYVG
ncbi:hypothetical protein [Kutzneria kofuensis]|uniref:Xanthosine utilization system XapX-like protein n=1 Tax=Kutzneria kofuensis TaxID=103725 RepID=A0A7W9KLH2_9PSEU|nr:hypothetical protein [Kutzneria kofuensis]MBB5894657.1 xanthosine utilization system XapX-like protein [Kutzneria kofuensis]